MKSESVNGIRASKAGKDIFDLLSQLKLTWKIRFETYIHEVCRVSRSWWLAVSVGPGKVDEVCGLSAFSLAALARRRLARV
jgi:hypothetical protein